MLGLKKMHSTNFQYSGIDWKALSTRLPNLLLYLSQWKAWMWLLTLTLGSKRVQGKQANKSWPYLCLKITNWNGKNLDTIKYIIGISPKKVEQFLQVEKMLGPGHTWWHLYPRNQSPGIFPRVRFLAFGMQHFCRSATFFPWGQIRSVWISMTFRLEKSQFFRDRDVKFTSLSPAQKFHLRAVCQKHLFVVDIEHRSINLCT